MAVCSFVFMRYEKCKASNKHHLPMIPIHIWLERMELVYSSFIVLLLFFFVCFSSLFAYLTKTTSVARLEDFKLTTKRLHGLAMMLSPLERKECSLSRLFWVQYNSRILASARLLFKVFTFVFAVGSYTKRLYFPVFREMSWSKRLSAKSHIIFPLRVMLCIEL